MAAIPETRLSLRVAARELSLGAWYRERPAAELMLFVHGLACSKRSFAGAWTAGPLRELSLLAFDLPGFGSTTAPAGWAHGLAAHAAVIAAVLDAHATQRLHLVAHSMGGSAALLLPDRLLGRLASLALVEPRLLAESCGVAAEASRHTAERFEQQFLPRFRARVVADPRVSFDVERADPRAFHASARSLLQHAGSGELLARFLALPCPAYFVYGAENAHLAELARLPASRLLAIPRAGHFPMQDNPGDFYAALARIAAGGAAA